MNLTKEQVANMSKEEVIENIGSGQLIFIPEAYENDKDVALVMVKSKGLYLRSVSKNFRDDKEIVLEAVNESGYALKYASDTLKNDPEIIRVALQNNGEALMYAPPNFKNDEETVLLAIKNSAYALNYASEMLRNNKGFAIKAMRENVCAIIHMPILVQDEKEVLELLRKNKNKVFELGDMQFFFNEKMKVLEILEEDSWMRSNVQASNISVKKRKF